MSPTFLLELLRAKNENALQFLAVASEWLQNIIVLEGNSVKYHSNKEKFYSLNGSSLYNAGEMLWEVTVIEKKKNRQNIRK